MRDLRSVLAPVALLASLGAAAGEAPRRVELAVIVHAKNPVTDLSLSELRAYFKMERQFWPNGRRCVLYLRPSESAEHKILLDKVYRMTNEKLQKYWVAKLFSGEIPAKPSYVPTAEAAGSRVREGEGAVSIVLAGEVPKDVRVLAVGGKRPGDAEYPLAGEIHPPANP
ncbi:MAG: hypothetical protein ACREID_07750 [Planctomycetota bacterium]